MMTWDEGRDLFDSWRVTPHVLFSQRPHL